MMLQLAVMAIPLGLDLYMSVPEDSRQSLVIEPESASGQRTVQRD
jgi:hypothetical protein